MNADYARERGRLAPRAPSAATDEALAQPWAKTCLVGANPYGAAPQCRQAAPVTSAAQPATLVPAVAGGSQIRQTDPATDLLSRVGGSPARLRRLLASQPTLFGKTTDMFGGGDRDESLNRLLAQAFPGSRDLAPRSARGDSVEQEKGPADPTLALPPQMNETKTLTKGEMRWTLKANDHNSARCDVDFKPDKTKVEAHAVSFVQTVLNQLGTKMVYAGGTATNPDLKKNDYQPYEEATEKRRVDHVVSSENDPFYGAEWDATAKKWKDEGGGTVVGRSTKGTSSSSAKMNDSPATGMAREGKGLKKIDFETVPTVLETGEALGALKWGYKIEDMANAPLELIGGTPSDCTDTPTLAVQKALEKFYEAKFDQILDSYEAGAWDLTTAHKTQLDTVVTKLKSDASLTVRLGGAADLKEANAQIVSEKRAEAVKTYLVGKGVSSSQIAEVVGYGSSWARVQTEKGRDEPQNRRVQVWVKR